ncbi:hypothetical protein ANO11243_067170 [Dothideomycetidae sp. 11243]|nr:hypothetical protein ANO11243_067170 [fungal sp. No.11243]
MPVAVIVPNSASSDLQSRRHGRCAHDAGLACRIRDMTFLDIIHKSKSSQLFLIILEGREYVLKVYHRHIRKSYDVKYREIDPFNCESQAYRSLSGGDGCGQGLAPRFFGECEAVSTNGIPHLIDFASDVVPPASILLEYIPDMHMLDLSTFTIERGERFKQMLRVIHSLGILHGDVEARHMMVQPSTGRTLWLDFDCAQTFLPDRIPARWPQFFQTELATVDQLVKALVRPELLTD